MIKVNKNISQGLYILYYIILFLATLWTLFSDDLRLYSFKKANDLSFVVVTVLVFILFCIAITFNCYFVENYLFKKKSTSNNVRIVGERFDYIRLHKTKSLKLVPSFNFILDVVATIAVALQVSDQTNSVVNNLSHALNK